MLSFKHPSMYNLHHHPVNGKEMQLPLMPQKTRHGCSEFNEYLMVIDASCGLSAGSTITPNYVDNSTSSVAPWCSCSSSGSQRQECDHFLGTFTDNICLRESNFVHYIFQKWQELILRPLIPLCSFKSFYTSLPQMCCTQPMTVSYTLRIFILFNAVKLIFKSDIY